ncbi:hypothetical protein [Nocardia rhizosphaerae]|uniref:Uncharacterized protein n=1 Tax=Nocardia rhizosphaerae TaxID=1691571 RepID=A0ABV8KZH2_9NOCA
MGTIEHRTLPVTRLRIGDIATSLSRDLPGRSGTRHSVRRTRRSLEFRIRCRPVRKKLLTSTCHVITGPRCPIPGTRLAVRWYATWRLRRKLTGAVAGQRWQAGSRRRALAGRRSRELGTNSMAGRARRDTGLPELAGPVVRSSGPWCSARLRCSAGPGRLVLAGWTLSEPATIPVAGRARRYDTGLPELTGPVAWPGGSWCPARPRRLALAGRWIGERSMIPVARRAARGRTGLPRLGELTGVVAWPSGTRHPARSRRCLREPGCLIRELGRSIAVQWTAWCHGACLLREFAGAVAWAGGPWRLVRPDLWVLAGSGAGCVLGDAGSSIPSARRSGWRYVGAWLLREFAGAVVGTGGTRGSARSCRCLRESGRLIREFGGPTARIQRAARCRGACLLGDFAGVG